MAEKTIRELALDAIDRALAESIRQQFISMALTDPTEDGGLPLARARLSVKGRILSAFAFFRTPIGSYARQAHTFRLG
jgi:hypothetical protein